MLSSRNTEKAGNAWGEMPVMQASYRRGILRAKVTLSDLTCWSARIAAMETLRTGMTLWLALPGLQPKFATVTWVDGFTAGLRFDEALHPAVLDAVIDGRTGSVH